MLHRCFVMLAAIAFLSGVTGKGDPVPPAGNAVEAKPAQDRAARVAGSNARSFEPCFPDRPGKPELEGRVIADVTIAPDGSVVHIALPAGTGFWQERAARCLVAKFEFEPAMRNGEPVAGNVLVPLNFSWDEPITDPKPSATAAELEEALRACYPADSLSVATALYLVVVNEFGKVENVEMKQSTGDPRLDDAGTCLVRMISFTPAMRGSRAVTSTAVVPLKLRPPR